MELTHSDIGTLLAVIIGAWLACVGFIVWCVWSSARHTHKLLTAIAGLIWQESDKIQKQVAEWSR